MPRRPYLLKKRGRVWYYRLAGEITFHTTGETTRTAAELHVNGLVKGQIHRPPEKIRFREFTKGFFDQDSPWVRRRIQAGFSFSPAVTKTRNGHLEHYILPMFGDQYPHEITAVQIEDWIFDLVDYKTGAPLAGGTKNDIYNTLNIVLKEMKRQKLIVSNPMEDVARVANRYRRRDAFTLEEIKDLFPKDRSELEKKWGNPYWATLCYLALTAGLRSQEVRALLWRHVVRDLQGLIVVQAVKSSGKIESILKMGDEDNPDHRGVLLPKRTIELLEDWRQETPFPEEDSLIFYGESQAKPLNKTTISKKFRDKLLDNGFVASSWMTATWCFIP